MPAAVLSRSQEQVFAVSILVLVFGGGRLLSVVVHTVDAAYQVVGPLRRRTFGTTAGQCCCLAGCHFFTGT